MTVPETRYANSGGVRIAYQAFVHGAPADAKCPDCFCDIRQCYFSWRSHSMGSITAEKNKISCGG